MKKYTKAFSITPHDTNALDPRPDAYYLGNGNYTDEHDDDDFYDPQVWFRFGQGGAERGSTPIIAHSAYGEGSNPSADSTAGVNKITGDSTTNFVNYCHWSAASSHVTVNDNDVFNIGTGGFEMMVVIRFEDNGDQWQHIAARDKGNNNWGWLRLKDSHSDGGKIKFSISGSDPVSAAVASYDTWYILGVSRDVSNNVQLWRDGATDGSSVTSSGDLDADDNDNLVIGAMHNGTSYVQGVQGDIAEFILWEKNLSTAERAAVVANLQDRYFNDRRGKIVTCSDPNDADTYSIEYPKIGTVIPESPQYIRNSGKYAEDIVGLQK